MADRKDDQNPGQAGPPGDDVSDSARGTCGECGTPLAPDQRYCLNCGARHGPLPGAVAGTVAALSSEGTADASAGGKGGMGLSGPRYGVKPKVMPKQVFV